MDREQIEFHIDTLKKMCHDKACPNHLMCPTTHTSPLKCNDLLDTQTAMAWMLALALENYLKIENVMSKVPFFPVTREDLVTVSEFCFQTLGQHDHSSFFRRDIFEEVGLVCSSLRSSI